MLYTGHRGFTTKRFASALRAFALVSALFLADGWGTAGNPIQQGLPALQSVTASFTATPSSGQAPLLITFTDTSTGGVTSAFGGQDGRPTMFTDTSTGGVTWAETWDFGDGTTTNLSFATNGITHLYTNANVVVTLTVSNSSGSSTAVNFVPVIAPPATSGWFTNTYGVYGGSNIVISPATSVGIFFVGDTVIVSNTLGTTVELYDYHFNHITNLPPPAAFSGLGIGHYFVQADGTNDGIGDRAQFSILPRDYPDLPHSDIGCGLVVQPYEQDRVARLSPGFARYGLYWSEFTTDGITYTWSKLDAWIQQAAELFGPGNGIPTKVLNIIPTHVEVYPPADPESMYSPVVDDTNSLSSWVRDFSLLCSNIALRYTNALVYEILNEPNSLGIVFTNAADSSIRPRWPDVSLPASMAVEAAAHAIKHVCPECQVWAPAALGIMGGESYILTNSFVPRYYRQVDAISYHLGTNLGPVDNFRRYFTPNNPGFGMSLDAAAERLNAMYHNKPLVVTECYPEAPDVLGRMNPWYTLEVSQGGGHGPWDVPQLSWDWRRMTERYCKAIIIGKGTRHLGWQHWLFWGDGNVSSVQELSDSYYQAAGGYSVDYFGWDVDSQAHDFTGCGPKPTVDGQAMLSWWLNGAEPMKHWLSGSPLILESPSGQLWPGSVPGLHFWEFKFHDGSVNTFIWADEGYSFKTNFGVGLTDIYSNSWAAAIGSEPVIAWGWNHAKRKQ